MLYIDSYSNELNPYSVQLRDLIKKIDVLEREIAAVVASIESYDQYDLVQLEKSKQVQQSEYERRRAKVNNLDDAIDEQRKILKGLKAQMHSIFNPFYWFDEKEHDLRHSHRRNQLKLNILIRAKGSHVKAMGQLDNELSQLSKLLHDLSLFDRSKQERILSNLKRRLSDSLALKMTLEGCYNRVESKISKLCHLIDLDEGKIAESESLLCRARFYEGELNTSSNSYERMRIHRSCKCELGDGSPQKLIGRYRKMIASTQRGIEKTIARVNVITDRLQRLYSYRTLIIDGSNMCYKQSKFIGVKLLLETVRELCRSYEICVIFDRSIMRYVRMSENHLVRIFQSSGAEIQIAQSGCDADELIVHLARNESCGIVSNDAFADYRDEDAVISKRRIRFDVISSKRIIIKDLDLDIVL